ncbi:MAG: TonB-dependent receptor plug domain-containing protein, partial [Fibrobacter sp.]|nr:TonB-dependent receptor plug domain-containing protein [Fibrobacter sp.]
MSCDLLNQARRYISVGCILAAFSAVSAQNSADAEKSDSSYKELPPMKVNVMRLEVVPEKMPQKIEVIDKQDLDLTPAQDITDVLKKNSSIDVIQYPGLLSGVGIRGFRPGTSGINQHALILIDGRPSGATNLASLQPYNVERIEVVKGPVSALYGPQAMGGVVNIVPKRSVGEINTQLKLKAGSYETFEAVAHSGGSINKYLNFDFSGMVYDQGKDFRIGSNYILGKLSDTRFDGKATHILANGDSVDVEDDAGAGTIRHNTKFDKHDFSLRLGTSLLDDRLSVDVRGEMFGADAVESPNDISYGDGGAGLKSFYRKDEEVTVRGNFDLNKFKVLQYWSKENSENYEDFAYGGTMYPSYSSGTEWLGFQAKDDIYLPTGDFILKPVITLGVDFNKVEVLTRRWESLDKEIAPYSPDSRQKDLGFYTQLFGDLKDGLVTATVGLRLDIISAEMLSSKYFPNNRSREEKFNVFSPSYGLTFSPIKHVTDDYSLTFYHNLGKGFIPQSANNIAGYSIGKPDNTGRVLVTHGNPELEPEKNITVDAGIRGGIKALGIDLGVGFYRTTVEDFVQTIQEDVPEGMTETYDGVKYPVASITTYRNNDDQTTMSGLEWDFEWNILQMFDKQEKLILGSNGHAVLLSENVTGDDTSEVFNVRNPNFNVSLTYDDTRRLTARLQTRFSGKQKDTDWSAPVYPYPDIIYCPFLVTDFALRVKVNE